VPRFSISDILNGSSCACFCQSIRFNDRTTKSNFKIVEHILWNRCWASQYESNFSSKILSDFIENEWIPSFVIEVSIILKSWEFSIDPHFKNCSFDKSSLFCFRYNNIINFIKHSRNSHQEWWL